MSVRESAGPETAGDNIVRPSQEDPFVRGLAQVLGGPPGEHAAKEPADRRGRFWTAARIVLALTCLTLVLHWVQKSPCNDGAWSNNLQYKQFCYTDVLALYGAERLSEGAIPYLDHPVEYPVLTGVFMGIIGLPVHALGEKNPDLNQYQMFYNVTAFGLAAMAIASVAMILSLRRRRPWDATLFALSPALLVTATVNWDLLAIVLAVAGIWLWGKKYPLAAGVLLGLGTAAKLWPGFLFVPLLVLGFRYRKLGIAAASVGVGVATWVAVNLPFMLLNFTNWQRFLELNTTRGVDWGTLWYVGRWFDSDVLRNSGAPGDTGVFQWLSNNVDPTLNLTTYLLIGGCWLGIVGLALYAKNPPRFAQLAFLVVATFLIFNKVWSQQFTLWLLPLLVLARPKWGAFLAWQLAELGYFFTFYGTLLGASGKQVISEGTFIFASSMRLLTVAVLCGLIVREILRPELDVVRNTYGRDPDGGLLNPGVAGPELDPWPADERTLSKA
jgi:uncharacterized membrane protein